MSSLARISKWSKSVQRSGEERVHKGWPPSPKSKDYLTIKFHSRYTIQTNLLKLSKIQIKIIPQFWITSFSLISGINRKLVQVLKRLTLGKVSNV